MVGAAKKVDALVPLWRRARGFSDGGRRIAAGVGSGGSVKRLKEAR